MWDLELAASQVESAGLKVTDEGETTQVEMIADIGALVWCLNAIPWAVPNSSPGAFRERLLELHQLSQVAPLQFSRGAFWLLAEA